MASPIGVTSRLGTPRITVLTPNITKQPTASAVMSDRSVAVPAEYYLRPCLAVFCEAGGLGDRAFISNKRFLSSAPGCRIRFGAAFTCSDLLLLFFCSLDWLRSQLVPKRSETGKPEKSSTRSAPGTNRHGPVLFGRRKAVNRNALLFRRERGGAGRRVDDSRRIRGFRRDLGSNSEGLGKDVEESEASCSVSTYERPSHRKQRLQRRGRMGEGRG